MRIAVFSDIHGNLAAFEAVLADITTQCVDRLVCLGDTAFNGPWPRECVAAVRASGALCVHGNTDLALLRAAGLLADNREVSPEDHELLAWHLARLSDDDLRFLADLPRSEAVDADGARLLFVHASVGDVARAIRPGDTAETLAAMLGDVSCDWLVMGHTHVPYMFQLDGHRILNVGAVSRSLDGNGRPSYAIIDTQTGCVSFRRIEYDVERAVEAARERGLPADLGRFERLLRRGVQ